MKLFQKSKASSNQVGIVILVFYNYIFIYVRISTLYSCTQTVACTSTVTTLTGVAPLSHLPCPLYKKRKRATLLLVKKITLSTLLYYYICCSFLLSILFFILYLLMYFMYNFYTHLTKVGRKAALISPQFSCTSFGLIYFSNFSRSGNRKNRNNAHRNGHWIGKFEQVFNRILKKHNW